MRIQKNRMGVPTIKLSEKEKAGLKEKYLNGMSVHEYRNFVRTTGYGVCRMCGKVVKYKTVMLYKFMVRHKCPHGKWCRAGTHDGSNTPKHWYCPPCYNDWTDWSYQRDLSVGRKAVKRPKVKEGS